MEFEKEEQKIDLFVFLDNFLREVKRLWLLAVLLIAVSIAGFAGHEYLSYSPSYTASASFTVKVANPLYASISTYNITTAEQMADTFPYILTSGVLQERVKEHLGIPRVPGIRVNVSSGSSILTISVSDSDPQLAYDVLNAVITYYPEIAEFVVGPTVLVLLDESGVPARPNNSVDLKGAIKTGLLVGVCVWAIVAAAVALLTNTIHSEEELKQLLSTPCLGQIPMIKGIRTGTRPLIHKLKRRTRFTEAFQELHLHTEKGMTDQKQKVLLVSSAIPGEGKTTVSVNLAVSLAQAGKKVLLIDCDLRNPSINKAMGIRSEHSLSEYLRNEASIRDILCTTEIDKLMVISSDSGKENDINLLLHERTARLIHASRKLFDYVIMDTPPCSLLADAAEVASLADCGLMVIRQNYASRDQILDGVQRLSDCQLPMLGCALNYMSRGFSSGYGYSYDYGYGYGYGYGEK